MRTLKIVVSLILINYTLILAANPDESGSDFKVSKYDITVSLSYKFDKLTISAILNIVNINKQNQILPLQLCEGFNIVKPKNIVVMDANDTFLEFTEENNIIYLKLPDYLATKDSFKVVVLYDLVKTDEYKNDTCSKFAFDISENITHINASVTRTNNWFPKIKGTNNDILPLYTMNFDIPIGYNVMASGRLSGFVEKNNRMYCTWQNYGGVIDRSLYFFISRFSMFEKLYPDFRLLMYIPEDTLTKNIEYLADVIHDSYIYFEELFGNIDIDEYKMCPFQYGYSGLFKSQTVPSDMLTKPIDNNEMFFPIRNVIHDISHTWWGNIVSADPEKEYWLNEGFAKFSEVPGVKAALGENIEGESYARLKQISEAYIDYTPSIHNAGNVNNRQLKTVAANYQGAMLLNMLKFIMGEQKFYKGMRDYTNTYNGRKVTSEKFINIMQRYCIKDIKGIFYDYLDKPGFAEYSLEKTKTEKEGNKYIHHINIKNTGDKKIFVLAQKNSDLEDDRAKIIMKQGDSITITVKSSKKKDNDLLLIDPDGIFPVREQGYKGGGGVIYSSGKEVHILNIVDGTPLGNSGIEENMILKAIDGEKLEEKSFYELNDLLIRQKGSKIKLLVVDSENIAKEIIVNY